MACMPKLVLCVQIVNVRCSSLSTVIILLLLFVKWMIKYCWTVYIVWVCSFVWYWLCVVITYWYCDRAEATMRVHIIHWSDLWVKLCRNSLNLVPVHLDLDCVMLTPAPVLQLRHHCFQTTSLQLTSEQWWLLEGLWELLCAVLLTTIVYNKCACAHTQAVLTGVLGPVGSGV